MRKTISLALVLALGLATEVAKADFTFGVDAFYSKHFKGWQLETMPALLRIAADKGSRALFIYPLPLFLEFA